jgi:2-polyprenyl-3-methyl-5-hydroxy-6-metoxy-1,4-benzoquinol methylase
VDARGWDERYAGRELIWSAEPNRFVVEQVTDLPAGRALDAGAGEGRNAVWLAERGWQVTAMDFSARGLDKARALADHRDVSIDTVQADLTTAEVEVGAYDLVLVAYLHLPRTRLAAVHAKLAAAVAPGGTMLIVGHDRDNLERGVGGPQDSDLLLDLDEVRADLGHTGLVIEVADQVERPIEGDDEVVRTAIDTLVRARRS